MKVAFMVGLFPSLSETFILNQVTGLIDRGCEVDIYADQRGDLSKLHQDVIRYRLLERTTYLPSIPENLAWRCTKGLGLLATRAVRTPLAVSQALNVTRYGEQALSLWLLYSLMPQRRCDYDIIHCQFGTQSFRGLAFQAMNAPQAKLVTTFRGQDISRFIQQKGAQVYRRLFAAGDYFLANCDYFKQRAIELGCPPERIKIHGSGLDCERFPFRLRQAPKTGPVRIASTGRLVDKKGLEYSIRAIAQCAQSFPNLEYLIIGEGPLRPQLEHLVRQLQLEGTVHLLGQKSQSELIQLLDTAHLFIAPSVTAADGDQDAPVNVLKEAMAMGLPVISTLHGGIPELVEEGVSGYLVPERDAAAIANCLAELIQQPERWADLGRAGRAFVEAHYDLAQLNDDLLRLYQSLLAPAAAAQPAASLPST